jgi:hypothetical protein
MEISNYSAAKCCGPGKVERQMIICGTPVGKMEEYRRIDR